MSARFSSMIVARRTASLRRRATAAFSTALQDMSSGDHESAERLVDALHRVLRSGTPSWGAEEVTISRMEQAITNEVYRLSHRGEHLLLRLYGVDHDHRAEEVRQAKWFGEIGVGPRVMQTWENGRLEEWIDGSPMTHAQMRTPEASSALAKQLRLFHQRTQMNHNDLHFNNVLVMPDGARARHAMGTNLSTPRLQLLTSTFALPPSLRQDPAA